MIDMRAALALMNPVDYSLFILHLSVAQLSLDA